MQSLPSPFLLSRQKLCTWGSFLAFHSPQNSEGEFPTSQPGFGESFPYLPRVLSSVRCHHCLASPSRQPHHHLEWLILFQETRGSSKACRESVVASWFFFKWLPSSAASALQHRLTLQQQCSLPAGSCLHHFLPSQGSHGLIESIDITNPEPPKHRFLSPASLVCTDTKMQFYLVLLHLEHSNSCCKRCFQPNPSGFQEMGCSPLGSPH